MSDQNISPLVHQIVSMMTLLDSDMEPTALIDLYADIKEEFIYQANSQEVDPMTELLYFMNITVKLAMWFGYNYEQDPFGNMAEFMEFLSLWLRDEAEITTIYDSADIERCFVEKVAEVDLEEMFGEDD